MVQVFTFVGVATTLLSIAAKVNAAPIGSSFGVPGNGTYDYVVVGAGNAGAGLAFRLAQAGHSVALIEAGTFYELGNGNLTQIPNTDVFWAGKDPKDTNPNIDWGFVTTPQAGMNNGSSHYTRGKCLGGNTARNYMTYQIGTNDSYQRWADAVGDQSYTFENFLRYFKKHQKFTSPNSKTRAANATPSYDTNTLGTTGPVSVGFPNYAEAFASFAVPGWQELGVSPIKGFTSGQLIGQSYSLGTTNAITALRETSETAYLTPVLGRLLSLTIYPSTLAKRILFSSNNAATGVVANTAGLEYTLFAKNEVIVSAGVFQSPQLLMVSGIGPSVTLQKHGIPVVADRPGVGQNMQDHILFGPSYRVQFLTSSALGNPQYFAEAVAGFNSIPPTGILTNPGSDLLAWEKIPPSLRSNLSAQAKTDLAQFPSDWPELEYIHVGGYFGNQQNFVTGQPTDGYNYVTVATALVVPLSRGTVDIASADTADPPIINPNWLTNYTDVEVSVAGFKRARQLMATQALKNVVIGEEYFPGPQVQTDEQIIAWLRGNSNTVFHAACTCAMGVASDPNAVVDSNAKVFGVSNLRVVDASAFAFLPPGHPMSTIYALAEKIADAILSGH